MSRPVPPFRADQVGSLLRPPELKQARAQFQDGKINADQLKIIEDKAILDLISKQEAVGLKAVTEESSAASSGISTFWVDLMAWSYMNRGKE